MKNKDQLDTALSKLKNVSFREVLNTGFARYSKTVILHRALPDAKDGLKPVQRRILYAMWKLKMLPNSPYKKSARVVGEVIGKYHPHGDSSVYEALVRMSQSWKLNLPLIDMHGNNGSIDGDSAAAMRYTEVRLNKPSEYLLTDMENEVIEYRLNYDDSEKEPAFFSPFIPHLFINGAQGIAAGFATDIPPHNPLEMIDACIHILKNNNAVLDDLLNFIKGPDFPTGGFIIFKNKEEILKIYQNGAGSFQNSSLYVFTKEKNYHKIIINELPYNVTKTNILKSIFKFAKERVGECIRDVRDESGRHGISIVIEIDNTTNPKKFIRFLFKRTLLQINFNSMMVAIYGREPKQIGLLEYLKYFINFRKIQLIKKIKFILAKLHHQQEILNGLIIAVSQIDKVIKIIRSSKHRLHAIESLSKQMQFSEIQAIAIVDMRLHRLTNTDITLLQNDLKMVTKQIASNNAIIKTDESIANYLVSNLQKIKTELSLLKRKTKIIIDSTVGSTSAVDVIKSYLCLVIVTKKGFIKKIKCDNLEDINNGKLHLHEKDIIIYAQVVNSKNRILIFNQFGHYCIIDIFKLFDSSWSDDMEHMSNYVTVDDGMEIIYAVVINRQIENFRFLAISQLGYTKRFIIEFNKKTISGRFRRFFYRKPNDFLIFVTTIIKPLTGSVIVINNQFEYVCVGIEFIPFQKLSSFGCPIAHLENKTILKTIVSFNSNDEIGFYSRTKLTTIKVDTLHKRPRLRSWHKFPVPIKKPLYILRNKFCVIIQNKNSIELLSSSLSLNKYLQTIRQENGVNFYNIYDSYFTERPIFYKKMILNDLHKKTNTGNVIANSNSNNSKVDKISLKSSLKQEHQITLAKDKQKSDAEKKPKQSTNVPIVFGYTKEVKKPKNKNSVDVLDVLSKKQNSKN